MTYLRANAGGRESRAELHEAARVSGRDDLRRRFTQALDLRGENGARHFGRGREHLRHVLHTSGEPFAAFISEEAPVVLHQGPTAGAVDDDRLRAVTERRDVYASQVECVFMQAGMSMQRTAAHLAADFLDS